MTEKLKSIDPELFKGKISTILGTLDKPLYRASEICNALEYVNPSRVFKDIPTEHKKKLKHNKVQVNTITIEGVYWIIFYIKNEHTHRIKNSMIQKLIKTD